MKRIIRGFPICGIAAASLFNSVAHAAGTAVLSVPPIPVTVTNAPSVNVNGTVPVTGTVNANITGGSVTATLPSSLTIGNGAANPVLSSNTGDPGRLPYQAQGFVSCADTGAGFWQCNTSFAPVPAGKRLVLQNLNWFGVGYPAPTSVLLSLVGGNTGVRGSPIQSIFKTLPFTSNPYFGEQVIQVDSNLVFYADPGALSATVDLYGVTSLDQAYPVNLTGYLIDCTVGTCAPIVAQ